MAAKSARLSWLPGGLAAALVIAVGRLVSSPTAAPLELSLYDRVQRAHSAAPSEEVVIVAIDETSIARLGDWPWPQDVHAQLIERLRARGARVIAFTTALENGSPQRARELERIRAALGLLESSNLGESDQARQLRRLLGDASLNRGAGGRLASAIRAHGDVIAPVTLSVDESPGDELDAPARLLPRADAEALRNAPARAVSSAPESGVLDSVSALGHIAFLSDADGVVRTDAAAVRIGEKLIPSIATALAARAADVDPQHLAFDARGRLVIGRKVIPISADLRTRPYLSAAGETEAFKQLPYWRVMADEIAPEDVRDKLVLVGVTAADLSAQPWVTTPDGARTAPVIAAARTTSSLLSGEMYSRSSAAIAFEWGAAVVVIAFAAFALPSAGLGLGALATLLLMAMLIVLEVGLLSSAQSWSRLVLPALAAAAGYGLFAIGELMRSSYASAAARDPNASLRNLGQTFQRQGQLDLAFETYQRCPLDAQVMDLLYQLGLDFERRRQLQKAAAVYAHIATRDPNYRDLRARRARAVEEPVARDSPPAPRQPPYVPTGSAHRRPEVEDFEPHAPARTAGQRTLGRYELERELGKGAMGVVYLGRDPKINRIVAIKAIPLAEEFAEDDLDEARARFFREAEMAGRLNHPSIVTVYDAGEDQGLAYIAMEYLRGQHLSHYTDPSRILPPRTVMLLVARVAEALHYAHRQNVVHRDIKPANIMFNPDTDELKITDFGIARLTDTSRTKTGIVLGTPSFMSPEQLEGRALDGRSDQFALGVSLYQLLSGHLPFRAESMPRLMQKIATEPHAPVRVIRPELPEAVDAVLDRALAKSADDRYATCAEFAAALRECAELIEAPQAETHEWLLP